MEQLLNIISSKNLNAPEIVPDSAISLSNCITHLEFPGKRVCNDAPNADDRAHCIYFEFRFRISYISDTSSSRRDLERPYEDDIATPLWYAHI